MKKIQAILLALVAVFSLGAVLASTAFGETTLLAEWLAGTLGKVITGAEPTQISGALLLEDNKAPIVGKAAVTCTGILDGTVNANGAGTVTKLLNKAGEEIGTLGGLALLGTGVGTDCVTSTGCAQGSVSSPIEVWPIGLPWNTSLILMENGEFLETATTEVSTTVGTFGAKKWVGYELLCLIVGLNTEDACVAEAASVQVVNNAAGDAETPSGSTVSPLALCTASGEESGVNETKTAAPITLVSGELLAVSSE